MHAAHAHRAAGARTCRARSRPWLRPPPCASEKLRAPSTWPSRWQPWPTRRCCAHAHAASTPPCAPPSPWPPQPDGRICCSASCIKPYRLLRTHLFFIASRLYHHGRIAPHCSADGCSGRHLARLRLLHAACHQHLPARRVAPSRPRTARAAVSSAARRSARAASFALRRCSSTWRSFCVCVSPDSAAGAGGAMVSPSARAKSAAHGWKACKRVSGAKNKTGHAYRLSRNHGAIRVCTQACSHQHRRCDERSDDRWRATPSSRIVGSSRGGARWHGVALRTRRMRLQRRDARRSAAHSGARGRHAGPRKERRAHNAQERRHSGFGERRFGNRKGGSKVTTVRALRAPDAQR